ncbi:septation protein A [Methylocaldum sp. MU1018]
MKLLFDFFPIFLFFIAFKVSGIYAATLTAIVATVVQVGVTWFRTRKVEPMHLVSLAIIVIFGGATLFLKDELFIKWKPTVLNWLFGVAFLASHLFSKRTLIERMLGGQIELPGSVWRRLNLSWMFFFVALGGVNLFVIYNFDTETWVNFKLFGLLGLTFVFVVAQSFYLSRFLPEPKPEE